MGITIDNLTIGYTTGRRSITIAESLTGTVQAGQVTCLIGSNGVGKSTLLRTIAAFQQPLSGKITIEDKDANTYTPHERAKTIGVVLTERLHVVSMTVREVVTLGRAPYTDFWGTATEEDEAIVDDALECTGMKAFAERMINTLSDGERQKVMIAKAIAQQTPIIILDEPTAFLDFPSKVATMRLLKGIARDAKKTIFLSTHDVEIALQIADTLWLMEKEKGISYGTPEEMTARGTLTTYFASKGVTYNPNTRQLYI